MNLKMLREDIRTGQVQEIIIEQSPNDGAFVFAIMRVTNNKFLLQRGFPTAVSALKVIEKMVMLPPLAGLFEEYKKPPSITIIIKRRQNEKNQHEQTT